MSDREVIEKVREIGHWLEKRCRQHPHLRQEILMTLAEASPIILAQIKLVPTPADAAAAQALIDAATAIQAAQTPTPEPANPPAA